jgi:hypothetical protein
LHPNQRYTDEFDHRPPHPLNPFTRHIEITEALREQRRRRITVTVVAVVHEAPGIDPPYVPPAQRVRLVTYEG